MLRCTIVTLDSKRNPKSMSNLISAAQYLTTYSVVDALQFLSAAVLVVGFAVFFRPLLRGLALAALLAIKPRRSKEQRLQRRQMRDANLLKGLMNAADGSPSDVADLRAMASRG
jgi:hypothetical protein